MKVPYARQKTDTACGPAVVEMIAKFYKIDVSQDDLIRRLESDKVGYTRKKALRNVLDELGLSYKEFAQEAAHGDVQLMKEGHLEGLVEHLEKGLPVIINYAPQGSGHYVVAHNHDEDHLIVHDPAQGENMKLRKDDFLNKWVSGNKKWKKWYMVVQPE